MRRDFYRIMSPIADTQVSSENSTAIHKSKKRGLLRENPPRLNYKISIWIHRLKIRTGAKKIRKMGMGNLFIKVCLHSSVLQVFSKKTNLMFKIPRASKGQQRAINHWIGTKITWQKTKMTIKLQIVTK